MMFINKIGRFDVKNVVKKYHLQKRDGTKEYIFKITVRNIAYRNEHNKNIKNW